MAEQAYSGELGGQTLSGGYEPRRSSLAFIVEALILLLFLVASLAIITQLFALSANKANESKHLEQAVIIAANAAERFSADPASVEETTVEGNLAVTCSVGETALAHGIQYDALITVFDENGEVYRLTTSRYIPTQFETQTSRLAAGNTSAGGAETAEAPVEVIE